MNQAFFSSQLRAARGLLGWTRAQLAGASGVSESTLHRIEADTMRPHMKSVENIVRSFEANGIEFTEDGGVRPKRQSVDILVGVNGLKQFFDGAYEHLKANGGTIVQIGMDETFFLKVMGDYAPMQRKRMAELFKIRKDIAVQSIICEGDTNFYAGEYKQYRWLKKEYYSVVPFYIYGDSLGIITFQTMPSPTIIVHKLPAITAAYRKQFEALWQMAKSPKTQ